MRPFVVTFQRIEGRGTEKERCISAREMLIYARSEIAASWEAKAILREVSGAVDWRMVADTCSVAPLAANLTG
jgi:hypothetical protein